MTADNKKIRPERLAQLAEILNHMDKGSGEAILQEIGAESRQMAEAIRGRMFTFEDLALLDARAVSRLMREVDADALTIALKGAEEALKEKLLAGLSGRAAAMIREDLEVMGTMSANEVFTARRRIAETARQLEASGQIAINRGG